MRWVCDRWKSAKGCYQSRNSPYEGVAHCTGRPAHPRLAVAALTGAEAERRFRLKAQHRAPVVAVLFRVPLAFLGGDNDPQRRALIDAGFGMRLHELDQGRPDAAVAQHELFVQRGAQGVTLPTRIFRRSWRTAIKRRARIFLKEIAFMALAAFDTLAFVDELEKSGVPEKQARAISWAIRKSHESLEVATKADLDKLGTELRHEIGDLRKDMDAKFAAWSNASTPNLRKWQPDYGKKCRT